MPSLTTDSVVESESTLEFIPFCGVSKQQQQNIGDDWDSHQVGLRKRKI